MSAPVSRGPDSPGYWKCRSPGYQHAFFCSCDCHGPPDEPFLGPAFFLGSQWYSDDCGMTWTNNPPPAREVGGARNTITVVGIDNDRGQITVQVGPRKGGECPAAWHRDSTTGAEYGRCNRGAGHPGNHLSDAGTEWEPGGLTVSARTRKGGD